MEGLVMRKNTSNLYYYAEDIQSMLGISRAKAYNLISELNEELAKKGYIILNGKIPKKYLNEKIYGIQ